MHASLTRLGSICAVVSLAVACGRGDRIAQADDPAGSGGTGSKGTGGAKTGNSASGGKTSGGSATGGGHTGSGGYGGTAGEAGGSGVPAQSGGRGGDTTGESCSLSPFYVSCFYVADFAQADHVPHYDGAAGAGPELGGTEVCPPAEALNWEPGPRDLCHVSSANGPPCSKADGTICCYEVYYSCEP